jgi:hypothetical protein
MIGRDHLGAVVFASCWPLRHCQDATEAEVPAIEEGVNLALQWTQLILSIDSDCSEAIEPINGVAPNILAYAFRVAVITDLLRKRESKLVKISSIAETILDKDQLLLPLSFLSPQLHCSCSPRCRVVWPLPFSSPAVAGVESGKGPYLVQ